MRTFYGNIKSHIIKYIKMDIQSFIESFIEVFDDEEVVLTPDTYFKELDVYSSLTALSIIAFADENYGVTISGKEIREAETVQDLFELINAKK